MFLKIATIALLPALIIQGIRVKKNTPRLPEPDGAREGISGQGKKLSLLIAGDSAAAGVGVETQQDALMGALIAELKNEYEIHWKLHAKTGHTSAQVIQAVKELDNQPYDAVITSVGVNDVTKLTSAKSWMAKQQKLYSLIQKKFQPGIIVAAGVPPMHMFPALPNPLSWLFGQYAQQMNQQLQQLVQSQANMQWVEYDLEKYKALNLSMAADGFHPSKEIYRLWAKEVADKIRAAF